MLFNRFFDRLLLIIGIVCLGMYIVFTVQARIYQYDLEESFDYMVREHATEKADTHTHHGDTHDETVEKSPPLKEGDLVGRLEIPRLDVSVMVLEGIQSRTLRLGAGHIPGTSIPGSGSNAGIAAHRDSFFRALSQIQTNDRIKFQTPEKSVEYRVVSTEIVQPDDVNVLSPSDQETITLVTCYPFYYVGPAPKRFIVKATAD